VFEHLIEDRVEPAVDGVEVKPADVVVIKIAPRDLGRTDQCTDHLAPVEAAQIGDALALRAQAGLDQRPACDQAAQHQRLGRSENGVSQRGR